MNNTEEQLNSLITDLESLKDSILQVGKEQIEAHSGIYVFDIYCTAILNKTINILFGYVSLIKQNNFLSAAPLVRIHLDTLLRIFAPHLWGGNVDDFALKVIEGKQINRLKDKNGNKLSDGHLARELNKWENFDWVSKLYKTGNGFVHFSEKHIFTSMQFDSGEARTYTSIVGVNDDFVPIEDKIGATIYMKRITNGILSFIKGWAEQKKTYK